MSLRVVERPATFPGHTVWGRTSGPCLYLGDVIAGTDKTQGIGVYLDERETRQAVIAWGWPTPEQYQQVEAERDRLRARVETLEGLVAQAEKKADVAAVVKRELRRLKGEK